MTGSIQALASANLSGVVASAVLADVKAGANAAANIGFQASGILGFVGSGSSGPPLWYIAGPPSTGGVVPVCYVTVTVNSGTNPTQPFAPLTATSGGPVCQWTQTVVGTMAANCTARIYADAAGTNQIGRIDFTVSVQRT